MLEHLDGFTHLKVTLETGRTHQIRVHMAAIGHPVAGDPVYGPKRVITELHGQCLHAKLIGFTHPSTGERLIFTSELPDYFVRFLNKNSIVEDYMRNSVNGMMIVTDMDGTMLTTDKQISDENFEAITRFRQNGGYFTVARAFHSFVGHYVPFFIWICR